MATTRAISAVAELLVTLQNMEHRASGLCLPRIFCSPALVTCKVEALDLCGENDYGTEHCSALPILILKLTFLETETSFDNFIIKAVLYVVMSWTVFREYTIPNL